LGITFGVILASAIIVWGLVYFAGGGWWLSMACCLTVVLGVTFWFLQLFKAFLIKTAFQTDNLDWSIKTLNDLLSDIDGTAGQLAPIVGHLCAYLERLNWKSPRASGPYVDLFDCFHTLQQLPEDAVLLDLKHPEYLSVKMRVAQWAAFDYELYIKPWRMPIALDWLAVIQPVFFTTLFILPFIWIVTIILWLI
jgi:hypothetical protein